MLEYGNPEPSPDATSGKVQRLSREGVLRRYVGGSAQHLSSDVMLEYGEEIVHPSTKIENRCKRWVVGSSPTRGAVFFRYKLILRQNSIFLSLARRGARFGNEKFYSMLSIVCQQ